MDGGGAEQQAEREELAPGSQRVPQRPDTSPTWTPPTPPTAATQIPQTAKWHKHFYIEIISKHGHFLIGVLLKGELSKIAVRNHDMT